MILEVATLDVRAGHEAAFEAAFQQASPLIASIPGYLAHELQKCVETPNRYLLLVRWQTLEAHTAAGDKGRLARLAPHRVDWLGG